MKTHRLNINFPKEEFKYLKMLCAKKGISITDFVIDVVTKKIEEEEDALFDKRVIRDFDYIMTEDFVPLKTE